MNTFLNLKLVEKYKSTPQKIRILTEQWVHSQIYCPNCGSNIHEYENNKPVADFYCAKCKEDYELKSQKNNIGKKVLDGAYKTMLERLQSVTNPSFFFLSYDISDFSVKDFVVVPKHFFLPDMIVKRNKGLKDRPEYIMCSIDLSKIPQSGKIFYIKNKVVEDKEQVLGKWSKTLFLRDTNKPELKGWIMDVMKCIDSIGKNDFTLDDVYQYEGVLTQKHPENKHVKDKIRQQLQFLRDKGYIDFVERGKYKLL